MLRTLLRPRPTTFTAAASPLARAPAVLQRGVALLRAPLACAPPARIRAACSRVLPGPLQPRLLPPPSLFGGAAVRHGSRKAGARGVKTKSAIKKRFRVSGGGTIRRLQGGKRHLSLHKSSARIRRLGAFFGAPCIAYFARGWLLHGPLSYPPPPPSRPNTLPASTGARVEIKAKGILRRYTKALSLSPLSRLK